MARPIKETPVLEGKQANRFNKMIKKNEKKIVPKEKIKKAVAFFQQVEIIAK